MTAFAKILELPLGLVGISDQASGWLRQAGIPVVRLGQESALESAFGLKTKMPQSLAGPMRCLLFDSRDLWSRSLVKNWQQNSQLKIDVAPLFGFPPKPKRRSKSPAPSTVRLVFLEELKSTLELKGGLWARLADYPFPYQGVGCLNGEQFIAGFPQLGPKNRADRLEEIQERYIAGLPVMISANDVPQLAKLPPVTGLESRGLPFLWRAEPADFAQWWQHRNQLQLAIWQTPTHYHVNCSNTSDSFCPVLEIWRGGHMASVPLRSESLLVRKDGLVFQKPPARHPAGFTAVWPDSTSDAGMSCLSA
jgi:hypothetical protein